MWFKRILKGTLDAEALKAAGVPFGPLFGQIKNGQDVVLEDGTKIIAKDFISAPKKGKVITILGDTRKTNASVRLGLGADVLVHESTYGKGDEKIAKSHGHSTNMQAAQVAKDASAKRLLLITYQLVSWGVISVRWQQMLKQFSKTPTSFVT